MPVLAAGLWQDLAGAFGGQSGLSGGPRPGLGGPDRPWRAVAGVLAGSLEGLKRRFSREILIQKANGGPKEEKTMKEVLAALESRQLRRMGELAKRLKKEP